MKPIRALVFAGVLGIALAPISAFADEHGQLELANANAQYQQAQQQVQDLQHQGDLSAANDRAIAVLQSEAFRQAQLNLTSNAFAMSAISKSLANAARTNGEFNAINELQIANIQANAMIVHADAEVANALARNRPDDIANANAQSAAVHQLANLIAGATAETKMSSARINADTQAKQTEDVAVANEENGVAMGANDLLAGDLALEAANLNVISDRLTAAAKGAAIMSHATASLANGAALAAK
jgi:hypothetical protein